MKKQRKIYTGNNRARLERNINEFKKEIGDRFIGMCMTSNNPQYTFVVEFWSEK